MAKLSMLEVRRRIAALFFLMTVGLGLLGGRLAYLQVFRNTWYLDKALNQRLRPVPVDAKRGVIYDRNYQKLAISISADAIYAVPAEIDDPEETAAILAPVLNMTKEELLQKLTRSLATVWLKRKLDPKTAQKIRELNLPGIGLVERPQRFYPHGTLAAHTLGIVGVDNQGLEGLEYYYDEYLRGVPGRIDAERDATGKQIPDGLRQYIPPQDGYDLVLTLDHVIQYVAEREIKKAVEETGSEQGLFLAMDPRTGEILALAIYPSFDPNDYQSYPVSSRRNVAVTDQYEPGSTFKIVTGSAALESGAVSLQTPFFDSGEVKIGGVTVHCWKAGGHGAQTFVTATENSCNPFYAVLGAEMLGPERFYQYLKAFGFGERTGVDFPGEAVGQIPVPGQIKYGEIARWANVSFGQGIAVTPLQLLQAAATIANDGIMMKPHLVKEIRDGQGSIVKSIEPTVVRQVLSKEVANQFAGVMRSVVVNGSGSRADIEGYRVAGKTGTAQVARKDGRGYGSDRISSFVGFAPVDDPQIAALVVLYHPKGQTYGGVIAAPVFAAIVEDALEHLGVEKKVEKVPKPGTAPNGETLVIVPNVRNYPVGDAQRMVQAAGLKVELHGEGEIVLDQVPSPNAQVLKSTTVQLILEDKVDELDAPLTEVPDVLGLSMREAIIRLQSVGLKAKVHGSGAAVQQMPEAGALVRDGSVITLEFE